MLLATALGLLCRARGGDDVLVIATGWPEADRAALEAAFRRWIERAHAVTRGPVRVHWVVLMPGDDLARVVRRRAPLDLVLGGPASAFAKLDRQGRLAPAGRLEHPSWRVLRRSPIGLAMRSGRTPDQKSQPDATAPAPRPGLLTFDDPRHDPLALAWAEGQLGAASWAEGYARLVRYAGHPRRIGRQEGSALAAVERGEAAMTPAVAPHDPGRNPSLRFLPGEPGPEWVEGVAVVSGGNHPDLARQFLEFLAGRGQAEPPTPVSGADLDASDLLADLLGATLVDAQDELWAAWAKLGRSARPGRAEMWMTRPPPWPPASVEKLLDRD
ncbi:MAG: extracellular solute-binding protein, partial [Planctomycetaceae bacterium]|nr:extracellular solute-binding protein [Planctomycetaceae bacterium]